MGGVERGSVNRFDSGIFCFQEMSIKQVTDPAHLIRNVIHLP